MTSLPDWLVERVVVDDVPPASRARLDGADPAALAARIAELRADNAAEIAHHPAAPAVAQIEARVADARRRARVRRYRGLGVLGLASSVAAIALVVTRTPVAAPIPGDEVEVTRAKGLARLVVFRQVGERAERVDPDTHVRAGDVLQLRYDAGGKRYGVIASVDGAGVVTLHYPAREDAPPEATAVAAKLTTLPQAYALDDAPQFERFFFITANAPIDVAASLGALRALAARPDRADADLVLPDGLHQWSLRVRK